MLHAVKYSDFAVFITAGLNTIKGFFAYSDFGNFGILQEPIFKRFFSQSLDNILLHNTF